MAPFIIKFAVALPPVKVKFPFAVIGLAIVETAAAPLPSLMVTLSPLITIGRLTVPAVREELQGGAGVDGNRVCRHRVVNARGSLN